MDSTSAYKYLKSYLGEQSPCFNCFESDIKISPIVLSLESKELVCGWLETSSTPDQFIVEKKPPAHYKQKKKKQNVGERQ